MAIPNIHTWIAGLIPSRRTDASRRGKGVGDVEREMFVFTSAFLYNQLLSNKLYNFACGADLMIRHCPIDRDNMGQDA